MPLDTTDWITAIASVVGVLVSSTAIGVTVFVWQKDVRRRRAEDAAARRREIVALVIGLSERTARSSSFRVVTQFWFKAELEWAFILPRVYYALEREDIAVARWAASKIRLIQAAARSKSVVRHTSELAYGLASWDRGELTTEWFADQVPAGADPLRGPWALPASARVWKGAVSIGEHASLGLVALTYAALVRAIWLAFETLRVDGLDLLRALWQLLVRRRPKVR